MSPKLNKEPNKAVQKVATRRYDPFIQQFERLSMYNLSKLDRNILHTFKERHLKRQI